MREVDLIIFDFDGTLVDTRIDIVNSVNYTLERLGLKKRGFDTIVSFIGVGVDYLISKALGDDNQDRFDEAQAMYLGYQKDHFLDKATLYPHVRETISHFQDKDIALISNRYAFSSRKILKAFGLEYDFKAIVGGEDPSCRKPSPCPVLNLIDQFKISKERAIMVGDMDVDVQSGKEAGILTCAVTYGLGKRDDIVKAGPDFIIDDMAELKKIIK